MDILSSLYVSLGYSTVQFHDNLDIRRKRSCSLAGFSSQNGERAWGFYDRRAAFCCVLLRAKALRRISMKKYFLFTVGRVCRVRQFTTGSRVMAEFSLRRGGWNGGAEVAETTVKGFLCCWFRRTGKAMGEVHQCWWICREIGSNITCFTFYIHLLPICWLSLLSTASSTTPNWLNQTQLIITVTLLQCSPFNLTCCT
jgi:hypothetical protein